MRKLSEMHFYLDKIPEPEELAVFFSDALSMAVSTLDDPIDEAPAFLQLTPYESGSFPLGVNIAWNPSHASHMSHIEIAVRLSRFCNAQVVTDLPDGYPRKADPFRWCIAEPDGSLSEISECMTDEKDGLELDETSKKGMAENVEVAHGEIRIWIEPDSGFFIKMPAESGDSVRLSGQEARKLADVLVTMADRAEKIGGAIEHV
ncbi:MAG: hypothetical protein B6245_20570 [Desulfobacteraceae bacterium 4572_88]|nr:MAG: hypothetical protein B6245_20570 [Desulfobacteraceae bacterium 4572_88]